MVCFNVNYLGSTVVDRRFSSPMVPWVIADIKRRKKVVKLTLAIEDKEIKGIAEKESVLYRHDVQKLVRFCCDPNNVKHFLYLVRDESDPILHCYLHEASDLEDVVEIFQTLKENSREYTNWQGQTKSYSSAGSLTSLCPDISPSNSQSFEVLYVGKIKVSHRKVPETFIDDALEKIKLQLKKKKIAEDNNFCKSISLEPGGEIHSGVLRHLSEKDENVKCGLGERKKLKQSFSHDDIHAKIGIDHCSAVLGSQNNCDITNNNALTGSGGDLSAERRINEDDIKRVNYEMGFRRGRAGSLGVIETFRKKTDDANHNRTMLFYVGKSDLRLISPDRKQVLFHKSLKDIVGCVQGLQHNEHFGFICREDECYVGYLFKCECDSVADDIVSVITQSFHSTKEMKELKQPVLSCEHCPMVWFHKLCADLEGLNDKKIQATILKRIETLPAEEQEVIHTKYLGTESSNIKEQNEFLMILLRTHCETKQTRHVHDTAENRSEFLNHYLGGSTIFMKAKRSLTSSFDHLLKRKGSQVDGLLQNSLSKESLNRKSNSSLNETDSSDGHKSSGSDTVKKDRSPNEIEQLKNHFHREKSIEADQKNQSKKPSFPDIAAITVNNQKIEKTLLQANADGEDGGESESPKTPMMNIFLQVGSTTKSPGNDKLFANETIETPTGSWRQAIFNRVVTPGKTDNMEDKMVRSRSRDELRDLWKKAINQQLLLIRMEKENARLKGGYWWKSEEFCPTKGGTEKFVINPTELINIYVFDENGKRETPIMRPDWWSASEHQRSLPQQLAPNCLEYQWQMSLTNGRKKTRQEEATVKRIKLEYDELGSISKEYMGIWELISSKDSRVISSKCDNQMLLQAIRQGVPPAKRGDVWHFLAVQYCLKQPPFNPTNFPNYDVPYEDLLKQLTSFQHAILIDLGRTFPNHPYFSSPLGPGQLALFNLLKAYSLLDPQVGYCQGLSFIAGVLLLHMSEEAAFLLLRHLMFRRGIRKQYLPDMAALQVQLYQLTRLLYDTLPRLYAHFDRNEIAPTLYAAPWMLTLFASQFPLGFVTRVFDLIFLEHTTDIIFRVILALLEEHMELLLASSTLEEIMNYLKNEIPKMSGAQVEKIMKRVLTMDISKRLREYEVEYHVLQEEMSTPRPKLEELKRLELENRRLVDHNMTLLEQLEMVNKNSNLMERSRSSQQSVINKLESQVRNLEITIAMLGDFIKDTCKHHKDIEIPGDIRRIISNVELAEARSGKQFGYLRKPDKSGMLKKSYTSMGFAEDSLYICEGEDFPNGLQKKDRLKQTSFKGVPLKVILDEDDEEKKVNGNSFNITSKITSGISSSFNSQNQIKNSKSNSSYSANRVNPFNVKAGEGSAENKPGKSFSGDITESAINCRKDDERIDCNSAAESERSPPASFHPLEACNDVSITYNGTTKLKSIKSGHKLNRSNTTISCE